MAEFGKIFLVLGLGLAAAGLVMLFWDRLPLNDLLARLNLGRLPGDINVRRDGFSFSFPWVSCLVLSLVLSLLVSLFRR